MAVPFDMVKFTKLIQQYDYVGTTIGRPLCCGNPLRLSRIDVIEQIAVAFVFHVLFRDELE